MLFTDTVEEGISKIKALQVSSYFMGRELK